MTRTSAVGLADGGIETSLAEALGHELPEFAAFVLLDSVEGRDALRAYFRPYVELAEASDLPLTLDTPTWRANADWGALLGYDAERLAAANADAVALVRSCDDAGRAVINGCVGPRWDDYVADARMSAEEATAYHAPQVTALAEAGADRVTSVTTLDADEGIGVVRAAVAVRIPAAVSFVVGADGRLADGSSLVDAIAAVDAATDAAALGFLVNCAHPDEVRTGLEGSAGSPELDRLIGFRLNAARHGDDGPGDAPADFAEAEWRLSSVVPTAATFGGCCGTDTSHLAELAARIVAHADRQGDPQSGTR
ncbi:homocysteine S-methyltransferase family protein [Leucobacter rhizosphaerae]|uniref:Homocysteine S-methyltransferase family protein n=1 Tax=Leucobacter rhizosphaerae TaxID=2932245 RepID=A0ABY4FV45_9MICO|nr:homocysteine S-methyltransferase family protein [Leucobacter rhizosphaerae]UOQ60150.1 homocysteine S-methyltransferase family protein [Leucobacter rhizosphaerae]